MKRRTPVSSKLHGLLYAAIGIACAAAAPNAFATKMAAPTHNDVAPRTDRIIVKLREEQDSAGVNRVQASSVDERVQIAARGIPMKHIRKTSTGTEVYRLPSVMTTTQVEDIVRVLEDDPNIEYAEPDFIAYAAAEPNDPDYDMQWALGSDGSGMDLPATWDITTGSADIVVAIIDSGVRSNHPDLQGRMLAGYDFISSDSVDGSTRYYTANDSDGRDADPTDPGDWVTSSENRGSTAEGFLAGCGTSDSSWHGTHVSGIVGASSNNGIGITGINWVSPMLPVRVLGKCGGYISDIADAVRWAAGQSVGSIPKVEKAANVINLSLSRPGSCSKTEQNAINAAVNAGATVVIAAGNNGGDSAKYAPGNCSNVIAVAATGRDGTSTSYSNLGTTVDISAPGGDTYGILSTLNTGTTNPEQDTYTSYEGTSMAAAQVTGVVSLMLSANPDLTPAEVEQILIKTAQPMGDGTCNDGSGSGLINAYAAVSAAQRGDLASVSSTEGNCAATVLTSTTNSDALVTTSDGGGGGGGSFDPSWFTALILPALRCRRR